MIVEVAIATTSLRRIPGTLVIAIVFISQLIGESLSTPTLVRVLGCSDGVPLGGAASDAFIIGHVGVVTIDLNGQLSARIVFAVAAIVSVHSRPVGSEGPNLFGDGIAGELDLLFAEGRVTRVHDPSGRAIVGVNVDLRLRYGAKQDRRSRLTGSEVGAFAQIRTILRAHDPWHTERGLGYGDGERTSRAGAIVGQAHFQRSGVLFVDVAEGKWGVIVGIGNPSTRSIGSLELKERDRLAG